MNHLGERLRQQRLAMGVSLQHISEKTRIGSRYLGALEAGEFKQLPGAIFARSFVRQYAEIVGFDASGLEDELQQIFPSDDGFPSPQPPPGALKKNLPNDTLLAAHGPIWQRLPLTTIWLASALAVSSLFYIAWQQMVLRSETREPAVVMQVPAKPPVQQKTPGVQADPPPLSSSVVPAAVRSHEPPSLQTDTARSATELVAPAGQGGQTVALRLVASEETWVSIAANGRLLFSGIMRPHEERTVNGVEFARMVIGNSAGIEVLTDGRSIGPIGPQGSVRVVMLTPGNPPQIGQNVDMPSAEPKNAPPLQETAATPVSTKLD